MNRLFGGILFVGLILLSSCAKKIVLFEGGEEMKEFEPVEARYDYLSAKAKIVIEDESGKITRGTLSLRAKKDSILWFTMSPGMGMEAIRGLFTPEKISIRDRVGSDDVNLTYGDFERIYGLKLSLEVLQNIIWANTPFPFDYQDRLVRAGKKFELTQTRNGVRYFSKIASSHGKVSELISNSMDDRGSLLANFSKFLDADGQPFPAEVLFKFAYRLPEGSNNIIVHLEWTSVEPNSSPLSFPFRF
jgi:hypothetical protein